MHPHRYAIWIGKAILKPLSPRARRVLMYMIMMHRRPDFTSPRSFTEKVGWRILHDRRSLIADCCDKLKVRERVGEQVQLPVLVWSGTDLDELANITLPERWVLKPNHGSGLVHFGCGQPNAKELAAVTRGWLGPSASEALLGDWGYSTAKRTLLVEEHLGGADGAAPADYKIFVFGGRPHIIQVDHDRFDGHKRRYYTPDWTPLDVRWGFQPALLEPAPGNLQEMLQVAAALGAEFDFIRVDLYSVEGRVYLGELTPYPESGLRPFKPDEFDFELGQEWLLPSTV